MRTFENFRAWFRFYRQGQHIIRDLGRWESFWRAAEWCWRNWRKR